jgi:hypothetical protein
MVQDGSGSCHEGDYGSIASHAGGRASKTDARASTSNSRAASTDCHWWPTILLHLISIPSSWFVIWWARL